MSCHLYKANAVFDCMDFNCTNSLDVEEVMLSMKSIEAGTSSVASKSSLASFKEAPDEEEGAPVADRPELSA